MPACPSVCLSGWTLRSRKHRMNAEISEISYERCDLGNYKKDADERWDLENQS